MSIQYNKDGKLVQISGELYHNSIFPGQITMGANTIAPYGWLKCDGAAYAKTDYPALYAAIGDTYNKPDVAADKFNVPDLQEKFVMGASATEAVGKNIEEQLPNIEGMMGRGANNVLSFGEGTGSFISIGPGRFSSGGSDNYDNKNTDFYSFNASKTLDADGKTIDNPAYKDPVNGKPVKVRPDSVVLNYFIKF